MANKIYGFIALTGGGAGALDAIDGTLLIDKDIAVGVVNGIGYEYYLDATSAAAENSPQIIAPNTNGGAKRWIRANGKIDVVLDANTGTVILPTVTSNKPAHGFITCAHASDGSIVESAEFEYGSNGTVNLIRSTANVVANAATASKVQLGTAVAANPVVITNATAAALNTMIVLHYS